METSKKARITLAVGSALLLAAFAAPGPANAEETAAELPDPVVQTDPGDVVPTGEANGKAWRHRTRARNGQGGAVDGDTIVHGAGFVDEDGDGYNDLAPDHDGDGIPNGQDSDWVRNRQDGTGCKYGAHGAGGGQRGGRYGSGGRGGRAQATR